ncbi:MAG TPA: type I secretion system permease/ATPase, partial [Devosia sp.]|nr:type I secretion system permease/ATPase [Devosia sp.]
DGEAALTQALLGVRNRGGVVIVAAHRPSVLAAVNFVLIMQDGRTQAYGEREKILNKLARGGAPIDATRSGG